MKRGSKHTKESCLKLSLGHIGQIPWNKGTKGLIKPNSGSFKRGCKGFLQKHTKESKERMRIANLGRFVGEKSSSWKGGEIDKKCIICDKIFFVYPYRKQALTCSLKCMGKWQSENRKGENSTNWKGGITPTHKLIRTSKEYRNWRISVFNRDDFTCQACGQRGGKIHADHVMPFAYFPDLRFEVLNGRTLCVECHRKTPTFGGRVVKTLIQ